MSSGSVALPVTGASRVCGTSASSAPSVTMSSTPSSLREVDDQPRERAPAEVRLDAEQEHGVAVHPLGPRVVEDRLRPVDPPRVALLEPDLRAASSGSRRTPPGRSRRTAARPRPSRGSPRRARRPARRRSSLGMRRSAPAARARDGARRGARPSSQSTSNRIARRQRAPHERHERDRRRPHRRRDRDMHEHEPPRADASGTGCRRAPSGRASSAASPAAPTAYRPPIAERRANR